MDASKSNHQPMWAPLSEPIFRNLWIAACFSNIGTWMQDVGSAWLMTSLTASPLMVALMQTATYLPFFTLSLPSGAAADVFDRRKLLIFGQAWMMIAALALGLLTHFHIIGPWWLLSLTLMLGIGSAISAPAWNALTPELVPRDKLEPAIALGSVSYNTARGAGSALGGLCVAAAGPGAVFLINALSFLAVIGVVASWKKEPENPGIEGERIIGAMRAGLRYVRHSPALISVMVRTVMFAAGSASLWALIPLVGREQLKLDSIQYGYMLSVFGLGCLLGAYLMPIVRKKMSLCHVNSAGNVLFAAGMTIVALASNAYIAAIGMVMAGVAWIIANSTLNMGAQMAVTSWVRARALSIYILVFQGSVTVGSIFWGQVAAKTNLSVPLIIASVCMCLNLIVALKFKLGESDPTDTALSLHWRDPSIVHEPAIDDGPVLVTCEYIIDPTRAKEFAEACNLLGRQRKRDGAYQWHLFCDLANPSKYIETFHIESWGEHVRQHERVTAGDRAVEQQVDAFHIGEKPIIVRHMISAYAADEMPKGHMQILAPGVETGPATADSFGLEVSNSEGQII